jgi:hypothetical protein
MNNLPSPASELPPLGAQPGQEWFDIIRRPTLEEFASAFGSCASMDGSVLADTVTGAAGIRKVFDATKRMYDAIAFKSEVRTPARVYLEWEGVFQGAAVAGVTVLSKDVAGLIEHVRLYHRPTGQVLAFSKELQRLLSQP